jgi:zinc D-Ala-D-Ala carboxypeptidase
VNTFLSILLSFLQNILKSKEKSLNENNTLLKKDDKIFIETPDQSETLIEPKIKKESVVYKVTREEILMGRDKDHPLNDTQKQNLEDILVKINKIRDLYGRPMVVSSGYRPAAINANVGGAANSTHTQCQAVDIRDANGEFRKWCLNNLQLLKDIGLWIEDFRWTPTWTHIQTRPASRRIFIPFNPATRPPTAPDIWDGNYDRSTD